MEKNKKRNIITDKLVVEKTGKGLEHWYKFFDKKGAVKLKHADIFKMVQEIKGLEPLGLWNQNLLTTSYEWDRGLKERGQKEKGFKIGVSRTFNIPLTMLYQFFSDEKKQKSWLKEKLNVRKCSENKSLVISRKDGTTVRVDFYSKGEYKSQAVIQHMKLKDSSAAAEMKEFWTVSIENLKAATS